MFRMIFRNVHTKIEVVEAYVLEVVKGFETVDPLRVSKQSSLSELGIDSLDTMELILDLEDKFGVRINQAEALKIHTVMDAISIFYKYKS